MTTTVKISISGSENVKVSKVVQSQDNSSEPVVESENILTLQQRDQEYVVEPGKVLLVMPLQPLLEVHVNPDAQQNMVVTMKATPELMETISALQATQQAKLESPESKTAA